MRKVCIILMIYFGVCFDLFSQIDTSKFLPNVEYERLLNSQWKNRYIAFLGDSITDKRRIGTKRVYWEFLQDMLAIKPLVFGESGHTWKDVLAQTQNLVDMKMDSISSIFIFAGTNDFNSNIPIGDMFIESVKSVNHNGKIVERKFREALMNDNTFYGNVNTVLHRLKSDFPLKQIIILTPIHRGFAKFSPTNIQPDERYANGQGVYISDYVKALKLAAEHWSVPVIDLFSWSGLQPLLESNSMFFANKESDLLHPNELGHYQIAKFISYQLLAFP